MDRDRGRVTQMYMYFMVWRFQKRLEHYQGMKGPFYGGEYSRCACLHMHVCLFAAVVFDTDSLPASWFLRCWVG